MLSIAQCTDSFLPVMDGVGRVSSAYARSLALRGHEVYVITPMVNDGYRGKHPFEILDFAAMPRSGLSSYRLGLAALDVHYLARAESISFDIVHTHSPGAAGMEAVRLADRLRVPLVGTFHTKYIRDYLDAGGDEKASALSRYFALDYFDRCDEIWVSSEDARLLVLDHGFLGNVEVFDNGAESEPVSAREVLRAKETFHLGTTPALLFAGSLERQKNLPRILEAAYILKRRGVSFQLLFAGQGPDEAYARALSRELELGGTARFLGQISDEALLGGLYAASALCLFPSQRISGGLVVREAAAQGTPSLVIAGASGVVLENGVNGLICGDDAQSMADAIEAYLSSPESQATIRAGVKQLVPASWERAIDRVEARYRELARIDRSTLRRKRGFFRREMEKVDLSLEKRVMDLIWRFLSQDTQNLYAYPYQPQKPALPIRVDRAPLMRSTPEAEGVSSEAIRRLIERIDADTAAAAHGILIAVNGRVIAQAAWQPYDTRYARQLYSLSKSVTATAIGMLVDEGRLSIDEKLDDIFYDKTPLDPHAPSHAFTVRNLLNMSTGSLFNEVGSALGADWEREFLAAAVKFPAGTAFEYNSMNTYMLAAVVRRKTGLTVTEYLSPRLYEPLGIESHHWEIAPDGTEKGGWGLMLTLESVAKIGQLYLNGGVWTTESGESVRLLSEEWIKQATRAQIETPTGEITFGYGHQIWMTAREGSFLFNGAFGQYMLALPDRNALVTIFSGTSRLFAQGGVLDYVNEAFPPLKSASLPPTTEACDADGIAAPASAYAALQATLDGLTCRRRAPLYDSARTPAPFDALIARLDGRVYTFPQNIGGLFPMILQNVHNNYTEGLTQLVFSRAGEKLLSVEFVEGSETHRLLVAQDEYTRGVVCLRDDVYEVRVLAQTEALDDGAHALHIVVHFIETPFTRLIRLAFFGDRVLVSLDECPSVKDASAMLLELAGVTRTQMLRQMMPLLKRERMQNTLRTFTTVSIEGTL